MVQVHVSVEQKAEEVEGSDRIVAFLPGSVSVGEQLAIVHLSLLDKGRY